ncbi:MAG TPA: prolipoprotein diacylglyceryl transferase [Chlamydiales bacterium]|jgi:prolipoprotein diacylglyceryl transferase
MPFYWDPKPELFYLPILGFPILWYSLFFALGFIFGFPLFAGVMERFFLQQPQRESAASLRAQAVRLTDRLVVYMVVATVVGARLGHFLFYERPSDYLRHPLEILEVWKGGLSSHGAAFAILIALWIFALRYRSALRGARWLNLLDFVSMPTALAGALIRIGNFFNQEILGTETSVPWAVVFGHPADRSAPVARHPVQLYEAIAYFALFFLLRKLTHQPKYLLQSGKLFGFFLVGVFGFRIVAECFKLEQSQFGSVFGLTIGQLLSVPLVVLGVYLSCRKRA